VNLNLLRLRAVWLLVLPFFWFAHPTVDSLSLGGVIAGLGLALRAWAAGTIHKERDLTMSGPYAYTRNPLYVGSFLIGVGVTIAGGGWIWVALFALFYVAVYSRTIAYEAARLTELYGDRYRAYARSVPAFLPRPVPYRPPTPDRSGGFRLAQYKRNREWEALLGGVAAFGLMAIKAWWLQGR
jgi:protein-S-isoprenylcysteine O-methyltransferase Ste14